MTFRSAFRPALFILALAPAILAAGEARSQWQISSQDGSSTLRVGFLAQPQGESLDVPGSPQSSRNLFLRRLRLIVGGEFDSRWSFFIDTDSPNLGKGTGQPEPEKSKNVGEIFLQDVVLTWSSDDAFKVDTGMLLVPVSHNTQQSAATLLTLDYGPYSCLHGDPTTSRMGRDYGVQLRGYPFRKHVEYRLGVFQGYRGEAAAEPFRLTGRLVWYPLEADTGFFYTGTILGAKRILAVGSSYDRQGEYRVASGDLFVDQPLFGGDGLTQQAALTHYDGRDFFPPSGGAPQLPEQGAWLMEAGYYSQAAKFGPFAQIARRNFKDPLTSDEGRAQVGLASWPLGHRLNFKLAAARLEQSGAPDRTQIVVQCQVFTF